MNNRERLLAAIHRQPVDRIPTSFRATSPLVHRLIHDLGLEDGWGPASRHEFLRRVGADAWATGTRLGAWSTFVPRYLGPPPLPPYIADRSSFFVLGIGVARGVVEEYGFEYPVYVAPPLAGASAAADIPEGLLLSRLDLFDFECMVNRLEPDPGTSPGGGDASPLAYDALIAGGRDVIGFGNFNSPFMLCCYLRGMEQFLLDLAWDPPLAERIIAEVSAYCLEFNRRELAAFGRYADVYAMWDDVAGQNGLLFSPHLFRRCFLPFYRQLIQQIKRYGLIVSWHCCGSVHDALPAMIDAGIDLFDVVQTSARDMALETVHDRYAGRVSMHGAVDSQKLLVAGTPEDVRAEVRKIERLWGDGGGIILGPSHEATPDTPLANLLAIYDGDDDASFHREVENV
jgi:uroporphyrinogen decarboxylase